ncbi:MAG: threonine--tRNA ligase [Alphaproteobacteria bacterium]|nr:threonine--tRNA ligase [Alphaproteobacteria bacterium]
MRITLPDGSVRTTTRGSTGAQIAASIGAGLAKAALAVKLDGELKDLDLPILSDAKVQIITRKDPEALELIRHDCAHLLAQAVQELYPGTQVTIGPVIEDGFYYDFARNEPFRPEDLTVIEAKMRELVARDLPTKRTVWDRDKAAKHFLDLGEVYKAEIIRDLPKDEEVRVYYHGDWHDLCRGPHLMSTGKIGTAFKLTKLAGAYWRGDAKNAQLQRIYGTAWRDDKELGVYLHRVEEAEKRDHRKLGREMDLFHIQEEAVGQVFWHPNGWTLYRTLENYVRRKITKGDYREVKTPQLMDRKLWEESGHWENYRPNMFIAEVDEGEHKEKRMLAVKPMNCPGHVQIFKQGLKSYRDLPLRLAEFGSCHRYEPSGALHGIMRVRGFVQDDAHIFCTEEQIIPETERFVKLLSDVYRDLGFDTFSVKLATRPTPRAGREEDWDRAESTLELACHRIGIPFTINAGEGTFYGPKLEFVLRDAIGRDWQCGTIQIDYVLPERLDAEYVAEDGTRKRPVMLHRAILGSLERFTGVLIEHFAGKFPLWLAPVQAVVATIVSDADGYADEAVAALRAAGIRAEADTRNEKINYKVREHSLAKVPYLLVAGRREAEQRTLAVRRLGSEAQENLALTEVISMLTREAAPPDLRV